MNSIGCSAMPTWNKQSRNATLFIVRVANQDRRLTSHACMHARCRRGKQLWAARREHLLRKQQLLRVSACVCVALLIFWRIGALDSRWCALSTTHRQLVHSLLAHTTGTPSLLLLLHHRLHLLAPSSSLAMLTPAVVRAQLCWTQAGWSTGWTDRRYSPPTETTR